MRRPSTPRTTHHPAPTPRRTLTPTLVLVVVLLGLPPVAATHADDLDIQPTTGPLEPLDAPLERAVTAHVPCEEIHEREDLQPVDMVLHETPPWLRVTVSPHTVPVDPDDCPDDPGPETTLAADAVLLLQATSDAPAFTRAEVRVTAALEDGRWNATANITVEAAFFNLVNVHAEPKLVSVSPGGEVEVPLDVTNLGNDRVRVTVRKVDTGDVRVKLPEPAVASSLQQGDDERTTTLTATFHAPSDLGVVSRSDTVRLDVVSRHYQRLEIDPLTKPLTFLVKTQGVGLPSLSSGVAALTLGAAALALGRGGLRS